MPHAFDLNAWNYGNETTKMKELLFRARKYLPHNIGFGDVEIRNMKQEHGKSFGLTLCKALAQYMRRKYPFHIVVPKYFSPRRDENGLIWIHFEDQNFALSELQELPERDVFDSYWRKMRHQTCIIRSSALDEDWIDPRSGVHQSKFTHDSLLASELMAIPDLNQVVVQQAVWGCGCVIDIGYSCLLDRVIARVARGIPTDSDPQFTSATWDPNALVAVYDPYTGEKLFGPEMGFCAQTKEKSRSGIAIEETPDLFPELIRGLMDSLTFMNIDFGVQLEVVVDPAVRTFHLIQIRPSPIGLRGEPEYGPVYGKLLDTTAKVNKVGRVIGEAVSINADDTPEEIGEALTDALEANHYGESPERRIFEGKIVLWGDYYVAYRRYCPTDSIFAATLLGAVAHVCKESLFFNINHGTISKLSEKRMQHVAHINEQSLSLSGFDQYMKWHENMSMHRRMIDGKKFYLASDGLIGQIYLLP